MSREDRKLEVFTTTPRLPLSPYSSVTYTNWGNFTGGRRGGTEGKEGCDVTADMLGHTEPTSVMP